MGSVDEWMEERGALSTRVRCIALLGEWTQRAAGRSICDGQSAEPHDDGGHPRGWRVHFGPLWLASVLMRRFFPCSSGGGVRWRRQCQLPDRHRLPSVVAVIGVVVGGVVFRFCRDAFPSDRWQTTELVEDFDDDLWGFGNSDDDEWFGV
jgi:hypothetical protein